MSERRRKRQRSTKPERNASVAQIFTSKMQRRRTLPERWADGMTDVFGTVTFFTLNALVFVAWIAVNINAVPGIPAVDPYPFILLTMAVSLEAIFLSVIVLISQNRAEKIADFREEIDFQVNVHAEREIRKMLQLLVAVERKLKITNSADSELDRMQRGLDLDDLERQVRGSVDS